MSFRIADTLTWLGIIRSCWRYSSVRERRRMVLINVLLLFSNVVGLMRPIIIGNIVAVVAAGGPEFLSHLQLWLAAMVGNMILYWVFIGPVRLQERKFSMALRQSVTETLYDDVTKLPWAWHQAHHTGDTLSRIETAAKAFFAFADSQYDYMNSFLRLVGSIGLLLWIAPQVGVVIAITTPPLYYVMRRFDLLSMRLSERQNEAERALNAGLIDYVGNVATLLALRLAAAGRHILTLRFTALKTIMKREMEIAVAKWALFLIALSCISAVALLFYLTHKFDLQSAVAAGTVVTVFQYLQQIDSAIQSFAHNYQFLLQYRIDIAGMAPIRESAAKIDYPPLPTLTGWTSASLRNLTFRYEDREHHIHQLNDVSITLQRGRRIALVGASGAGKSTLLILLRGLHQPASGQLLIDGQTQDFSALQGLSTLALQDTEMFEDTLRYNITCGVDTANGTLESVIDMACLKPVIDPLPDGLDTNIRERGVNLSGGQKQRLALARALYAGRDSSLLLLDEPTSSLDSVTEGLVFDRLFAARADVCIVASLHRLHLLDRFDHIYVMAEGRVVEEGAFAELMARQGALLALWQAQGSSQSS